jgi:Caspase domain
VKPVKTAVLALALLGLNAWAEKHALLVGVSNYPALEARLQLDGPRNDIVLIRSVLERRGFEAARMQVLADGVDGAGDPTRAAILGALEVLVARAKPGDLAYLYFAGHGSQQPVDKAHPAARNEPDGLFEIFLPRDVGKWDDKIGAVHNAIVDHELAAHLDALLGKGVFVFAVFDACHSATLMRGVDDGVKYRQVSPSALGVPHHRLDLAQADALRTRGGPAREAEAALAAPSAGAGARGGYVAFYAAQTTETTPEMRLPAGHPQRKPYGLFSFTLAEALATLDGASYRQLGQHVLARYAAQNVAAPTPLFSGSHLDAPVFGSEAGSPVRQWPLETTKGLAISAGVLHQLAAGELLAVVASPLAKPDEVIGYLRIDKADVLSASLSPVAHDGKPAPEIAKLPVGAQARQTSPQLNLQLRVTQPAGADAAALARVRSAAEAVQKARPRGVDLQWVAPGPGQEADLRLLVEDGSLWLVSTGGQLVKSGPAKTVSIKVDQADFEAKFVDTLQRIGKALNLLRIGALLEGTAAARNLELSLAFVRKDGSRVAPATVPQLHDGDTVELTLRNKGRMAVDVTALYVDGDWGIGVLYPVQPGASNRLEAGASDSFKIEIHDDTSGLERLLLIGVEARTGAERYDFSYLAQAQLLRTRTSTAADAVHDAFTAAGFGEREVEVQTRGAKPALPGRTEMRLVQWRVLRKP